MNKGIECVGSASWQCDFSCECVGASCPVRDRRTTQCTLHSLRRMGKNRRRPTGYSIAAAPRPVRPKNNCAQWTERGSALLVLGVSS